MTTPAAVAELRRAALIRLEEVESVARELRGPLGPARQALSDALTLVERFPTAARSVIETELGRATDAATSLQLLYPVLRQINHVLDLVETHLAHGTRTQLSQALADEVSAELATLNLPEYHVVLSHGEASNFSTVFGDLQHALFAPLSAPPAIQASPAKYAFFRIPRVEGSAVPWRPILLGHEVAHIAVREHNALAVYGLDTKFDFHAASAIPNPRAQNNGQPHSVAMGLFQIATAWATELICDARALHRYGPAAVAALAEYLPCVESLDAPSSTHPPGWLRIRLLERQLGIVDDARVAQIAQPWFDLVPKDLAFTEEWASHLSAMFLADPTELARAAAALPGSKYDDRHRSDEIHAIADLLRSGVPGSQPDGQTSTPTRQAADVVNAVWLARSDGAVAPVGRLAQKTLEDLEFVAKWKSAGGILPGQPTTASATPERDAAGSSVLSAEQIRYRLSLGSDPRALVVAPLLHEPKETGLDVRLGRRFIVFRRSSTPSLDPLDTANDPRSVQTYIELTQSEQFVLHPHEVVLGATLEYLVMPSDLSGQVITRSSYGRLGLLSATAVQVHPGFRGCLTLELVNLSTIPITLTPGERVAQLVLWHSGAVDTQSAKYSCPIGPEFSRVRDDPEARILRQLRGV